MRRNCILTWLFLSLFVLPSSAQTLPKGVAWLWEFDFDVTAPPLVSGNLVLVVAGDQAYGLRTSDGERVWSLHLPGSCSSSEPLLQVGGVTFLYANGHVMAVDIASGREVWQVSGERLASRLCAGRLILLEDGEVRAVDAATGETRWRLPVKEVEEMSVAGSRLLYATRHEMGLWDLSTGKSLWSRKAGDPDKIELSTRRVYLLDWRLTALDSATGRSLWSVDNVDEYSLPKSNLLIARSGESLRALDPLSGKTLWRVADSGSEAVMLGPNIVATADSHEMALRWASSGKAFHTSYNVFFPPLLVGAQILLADADGSLHRLDARTGKSVKGIANLYGSSDPDNIMSPRGVSAGGLSLLPAGSALVAFGPGPGRAHQGGAPELTLGVDSPQTPGKIRVAVEGRYQRGVTVTAHRWLGPLNVEDADLATMTLGPALASARQKTVIGRDGIEESVALLLKEPGTYVLQARGQDGSSQRKAVRISQMALTMKVAPGELMVQSVDALRNSPMSGVAVEVLKLGELVSPGLSGVTGLDGVARLQSPMALDQPMQVGIRRGAESFQLSVKPEDFSGGDKVFLQTDRPLYRPGPEVHFKGVAAKGEGVERKLLEGAEVLVEIHDSGDNALLSQTMLTDEWGSFHGTLTLPAEPPLGGYRLSAKLSGQEAQSLPFEVQEYRKPPFEIAVVSRAPLTRAGEALRFDLKASYYFGGPVPGASVKVTVRRAELSGRPAPGNPGYHAYADFISETTIKLDASGLGQISIPTESRLPDSEYLVDVEVTGPSGQVVEGSASALVSGGAYSVYLEHVTWYAAPEKPALVSVDVLDRLGSPHAAAVKMQVQREEAGRWKTVSEKTLKVGPSGHADFAWTPVKAGGNYRITAHPLAGARDPHEYVELYSYVWGSDLGYTGAERVFKAEKSMLSAGETARLLYNTPLTGSVLLTVEGDKLFESRLFNAKAGAQVINLPILAEYAPGVTVKLAEMTPYGRIEQQVALVVPDDAHKLNVGLSTDKAEYRPGESALVSITVTDAAGLPVDADASLAVVDESLFALRPDQVPAVHGFFFGPHANKVQTFNFEPVLNAVAGFQTVPTPTRVRKAFKDTAFWLPNLLIENGRAQVSVPLPDNLTRWRATSRAASGDLKVGQGTATLVSNLPLMVQAILPRFVVEGDSLDLLALVSNRTKAPQDVAVDLNVHPGRLETTSGRVDAVAPDGQGRVVSRLTVEENKRNTAPLPSRLEVEVTARTAESGVAESDAEQISVPILDFGVPYAAGKSGLLKAGSVQDERLVAPRGLLKPTLEIRVAGSPTAALQGALEYLVGFPYGCVEQTMSRFLPTVIASEAMDRLGLPTTKREELQPMVETGLRRLYGYQHSDGGWGWWEYDETHPYMTGYVIAGLASAREAGFTVSESVLVRGRESALDQLRRLEPKPRRPEKPQKDGEPAKSEETDESADTLSTLDTRVYLAWALASSGEAPTKPLSDLSGTPKAEFSTYSVALLALAWQAAGDPAKALPFVEELEARSRQSGVGLFWPARALEPHGWTDDDVEATSLALRALLAARPNSPVAAGAVTWLLSQRQGAQWKSTRDTAQAVLALLDYAGTQAPATESGLLEVLLDGEVLQTMPLDNTERKLSVPSDKLLGEGKGKGHSLELRATGSSAVYAYRYGGFLRENEQVDLPADNEGLRLLRTYVVDQPGQILRQNRVTPPEILNLRAGQEVEVELEFTLPNRMQYLKLEDPRPAGLEVIGGSLGGSVTPSRHEDRDAFSAFFFTELEAGKHYLTYRLRAETPGEFRSLPARLELMYAPSVFGASPSQRVRVSRPGEGAAP